MICHGGPSAVAWTIAEDSSCDRDMVSVEPPIYGHLYYQAIQDPEECIFHIHYIYLTINVHPDF